MESKFLKQLTGVIEDNLSNEQFGVSELAGEIGMSRSNLLRKVKKETNLSVSQFIRNVRLQRGMELLKEGDLNVSEVSFKVGFGSTSYFIKCFHEYFGFPPGETGKRELDIPEPAVATTKPSRRKLPINILLGIVLFGFVASAIYLFTKADAETVALEKSIAVLPFVNNSNDSSNVYLINGLMESLLTDLQKIEDLKVVSRTSVEKYRNSTKSIPEMAGELNVNYVIEGSGQKMGDEIVLHVQLIQGKSDRHLWAEKYSRQTKDIFRLQAEIAKNVAKKIQAVITPEEEQRMEEQMTDDLVAYDYFLKAKEKYNQGTKESLEQAISFFEKAITQDPEFARAYADLAITYYYLDIMLKDKIYGEEINGYSDKALLFAPKSPQSLISKAMFYMHGGEYDKAVPHLEKALEYNPNSAFVINTLSDFYARYSPNTEKYLEYALKGIQLDIASNDSVTISYIYLHVSNALIQNGFVDESLFYINKSLDFNPENPFSAYVKVFIRYAKTRDSEETRDRLVAILKKDTTRLDVLQDVGKIHYFMGDYETAFKYYEKFVEAREKYKLGIYTSENAIIGDVYERMGKTEKAKQLYDEYWDWAQKDESVYKSLSHASYYMHIGETEKALEQFRLFSEQDNIQYWLILFMPLDPFNEGNKNKKDLKALPEYEEIWGKIETRFWNQHNRLKATLKEKKLL